MKGRRPSSARPRAWLLPVLLPLALWGVLGARCGGPPPPLAPLAGLAEYQEPGVFELPGARLCAANGTLGLARVDLELDTRLGRLPIGARWDSASAAWRWSFELRYDGATFRDASGALHATDGLAGGEAIPGTRWTVLDATRVATKGGLVHVFDAEGRLAAVHWRSDPYPRLVVVRETLAGLPRAVAIRQHADPDDPDAWEPVAELLRDAAGRLVGLEDRAGRRAEFVWDAEGRLVAARDGLDVARGWPGFRYEYAGWLLAAVTSSEGERIEYAWAAGRPVGVQVVGAPGATWEIVHQGPREGLYGVLLRDPLGGEWRWRFDAERRVHARTDPEGDVTSFAWQGRRVVRRTDPAGVSTRFGWLADDLVEIVEPSGNVVRITRHPEAVHRQDPGQRAPLRVEDSLGLLEQRGYDAAGRLLTRSNGAGETTRYAWGALGELVSVTDPSGRTTTFSGHAEHGHPTVVTTPDAEQLRGYDAVGNLTHGGDLSGETGPGRPGVVSRSFDADRNVSEVVLVEQRAGLPVEPRSLRVEHRSDGRRRRILRPYGGDTEFVYDAAGRMVERRERADGAWRTTRFERDPLGRVTRVDRPNGTWTGLGWTPAGRRGHVAAGRGGVEEQRADLAWSRGRLVAIQDAAHAAPELLAYDDAGRPLTVRYPDGEWLQLGWDLRSRRSDEIYWLGGGPLRHLRWVHDAADRPVELRDGETLLVGRRFGAGRWIEIRYGNGLVRSARYADDDGLLEATTTVDAAGATVEATQLSREPLSGLLPGQLWEAVTWTGAGLAWTSHEAFLLAPAPGAPLEAGPRSVADEEEGGLRFIDHDALGNVTARFDRVFVHDPEHSRLASIERLGVGVEHVYAWDEAGQATQRDGVALAWDAAGRIAAIGELASFAWDALGRPLGRETGGQTTRLRFGGRVLADASGAPRAIDRGEVRLDLVAGEHRFRHYDFRGNVKFVSDVRGEVVAHRRYRAYGTAELRGDGLEEPGFAQGLELGDLVLLGSRLYDAAAARFLAPDPVFQVTSAHAYALGNPLWFWDPDGRSARTALAIAAGIGVVGVAVGAAVAGAVVATPAATLAGVTLALFSLGFSVGIATPNTATAPSAAGGIATLAGALVGFKAAALPAGFVIGQAVRSGIHNDFGSTPAAPGQGPGGGASAGSSDGPGGPQAFTIKIVELTAEPPSGGVEPGGCAPTLAGGRRPRPAWMLAGLLGLQLLLGRRAFRTR